MHLKQHLYRSTQYIINTTDITDTNCNSPYLTSIPAHSSRVTTREDKQLNQLTRVNTHLYLLYACLYTVVGYRPYAPVGRHPAPLSAASEPQRPYPRLSRHGTARARVGSLLNGLYSVYLFIMRLCVGCCLMT